MSTLAVRGLRKSYGGIEAVRGLSFDVAAGEMVALIGPNGAGKTTCFNLLNGQVAPEAGEILLEGRSIAGLPPRRVWHLGVGRTFQITETFGSMSVRDNVQMALLSFHRRIFKTNSLEMAETDQLLAQVGMQAQAERPCAELAYGDLKRVELAMALASHPRLLLMDEPTAGMAREERDDLMSLATGLARSERIAVLFTEHDMEVVFGRADRVLVLHAGELIASGTPAQVRANEKVREVYLGHA